MRGFCPECHNEIDETEYIVKEKMCRDCFNKKKGDEDIEIPKDFIEILEELRDFVLDAPILSGDIYDYRNYLSKIKDKITEEIKRL